MAAGAAVAEPQGAPAGAPEQQPATPPASGSGGGGAAEQTPQAPAGGAAPAGGPQAGGQESPAQHAVPWARFREVQTERTRVQREYEQYRRAQQQALEQAQSQWAKEREGLQRQMQDAQALEEALAQHPDLADQLYQRLNGNASPRRQHQGPAQPVQLPPELTEKLSKLDQVSAILQAAEERNRQAQQAMALQRVEADLKQVVTKVLADRKYTNAEKLTPLAMDYVLWKVRNMEDASMEDVPHLLADFLMPWEEEFQSRQQSYVAGKRQDATSPPMPGGAPGIVAPQAESGANDEKTTALLAEMLKQRGWRD